MKSRAGPDFAVIFVETGSADFDQGRVEPLSPMDRKE